MTPKGVEHSSEQAAKRQRLSVKPSMTPKGVEHAAKQRSIHSSWSETFNDAERR
jgi:hypothetical protein